LDGGFHERRKTKLVALVNSQAMKSAQQEVHNVVMACVHTTASLSNQESK